MKKVLGILICLMIVMLCTFAMADIKIDAKSFPDDNFRAYINNNCDTDKNGSLSDAEIKAVTTINCGWGNITDLKGIEHFTALTELWCAGNQLTSLDTSKNIALKKLVCFYSQLKTLDISKNIALTELRCNFNQLTTLDVSKNTALTHLGCNENQLTELDVSKNLALTELFCSDNQLTKLDISKNTALKWLWCAGNQLNMLEVNKNTELMGLWCSNNQLTKLDVSKCTALVKLVKSASAKEHTKYGFGWWTDDGAGDIDWNKSYLIVDKTVKVFPAPGTEIIKVASITLNKTKASIKKGKTLQLTVKKILPKDATDKSVTWKSSNKKVATVDSKGKVKAVGKGTCTITCTAKDGSKVKAKCKITVK